MNNNLNRRLQSFFVAALLVASLGIAGCGKEVNSVAEPPPNWKPTPVGEDDAYNARMEAEMSGQATEADQ
ncbi:hypothetical protein Poly51_19540 [Rubripirellula tenax]|uniref:Secreted protein n=1 Tax=Rubripirellula tenax TaxID=2528015 RepID=A0A5C6FCI7_9BACT|nr:hypothetical protein [Rubripirellula tenax]TWU59168.1 hypothetical protein Poly51_19540 [Rubripirellula tenax]